MPLPSNVSVGTVTGTLTKTDGTPSAGVVRFRPDTRHLLDASAGVVLMGLAQAVALSATGSFVVSLVATDDADLDPTGWMWDVCIELVDQPNRNFSMSVPGGVTTDIADV